MLKLPLSVLLLAAHPGKAAPALASVDMECGADLQNVELDTGSSPTRVCVAPEVATYLRFDTAILIERTVLEGGGIAVTPSLTGIILEATRDLASGERRRLTVFFADGREPESATFILLGHSTGKLRQVNVFRRERTPASLRQEAEEQRQRAEGCEQQLAQCSKQVAPAAVLERVLKLGERTGLTIQWRKLKPPADQRSDFKVWEILTARVEAEEGQREVAVRVRLGNNGTEAWTAEGASLMEGERQVFPDIRVLPNASVPPGLSDQINLITEPMQQELTGTYTLRLWGGGRELTLEDITFP